MDKITLPSGATFEITLLSVEKAWAIEQRIASILHKIDVDLTGVSLKEFFITDVVKFTKPILAILGNQEVIDCAKVCWERCLYDGLKIDGMTFEKRESRKDFIKCVYHALSENISPFFEDLLLDLGKKL